MGLSLVSGVRRFVSRRLVQLQAVLLAVLGAVLDALGGRLSLGVVIVIGLSAAALFVVCARLARVDAPRLIPEDRFESDWIIGITVIQFTSGPDPLRGYVYMAGFLTSRHNSATEKQELGLGFVSMDPIADQARQRDDHPPWAAFNPTTLQQDGHRRAPEQG